MNWWTENGLNLFFFRFAFLYFVYFIILFLLRFLVFIYFMIFSFYSAGFTRKLRGKKTKSFFFRTGILLCIKFIHIKYFSFFLSLLLIYFNQQNVFLIPLIKLCYLFVLFYPVPVIVILSNSIISYHLVPCHAMQLNWVSYQIYIFR